MGNFYDGKLTCHLNFYLYFLGDLNKGSFHKSFHLKLTCHLNFNKYNTRVLGVSFCNQRLQLLSHLQNNVINNLKVFHPLVIIILCHENVNTMEFYALTQLPISWFTKRSKSQNNIY
jgi:hypothetical protein